MIIFNKFKLIAYAFISSCFIAAAAEAAGTLTPIGSPDQPIQIKDHHVEVSVTSGFARTEVTQTFYNPNSKDLEAIYTFPVPRKGALSEFSMISGESKLNGEVLSRKEANEIYEDEKSKGGETGVANKNAFDTFEFKVHPVRANQETKISFVYYQPLEIDSGIGRYLYPLEDGGTDDAGKTFWIPNSKVENSFSANLHLRTSYPIADIRLPGFENSAQINKVSAEEAKIALDVPQATLNKDLILYYRLEENLPGRVEVIPFRSDESKPGTFMIVATPGIDLGPIAHGADYTFVLDVSGSMAGKLQSLALGVSRALGELKPEDRFRIVLFSSSARYLTSWQNATLDNIQSAISKVEALRPENSTNIYDGMELALRDLDADRVSSVILVTDGVTNTGIVDTKEFAKLMKQNDVRVFGFLMGNNANWPLMKAITESSGGFYQSVSNSDDIMGQLILAKKKIFSEALHDATLSISGVKTFDVSEQVLGKIYRGEQLVLFGRYEKPGKATLRLNAKLSGQDKVYETTFDLPSMDKEFPEIERLWALERIEQLQFQTQMGDLVESETKKAIEDIGISFQLVTDETSMLVLNDEAFKNRGIERRNLARMTIEHQAQAQRASNPHRSRRVDNSAPMFPSYSHSTSNGGGAIDPLTALSLLLLGGGALLSRRRNN